MKALLAPRAVSSLPSQGSGRRPSRRQPKPPCSPRAGARGDGGRAPDRLAGCRPTAVSGNDGSVLTAGRGTVGPASVTRQQRSRLRENGNGCSTSRETSTRRKHTPQVVLPDATCGDRQRRAGKLTARRRHPAGSSNARGRCATRGSPAASPDTSWGAGSVGWPSALAPAADRPGWRMRRRCHGSGTPPPPAQVLRLPAPRREGFRTAGCQQRSGRVCDPVSAAPRQGGHRSEAARSGGARGDREGGGSAAASVRSPPAAGSPEPAGNGHPNKWLVYRGPRVQTETGLFRL